KVYLSNTSSTVIYEDDAIPMIKALKKENRKNDVYCFLSNLFWIYHCSITPNLQSLSLQSITFHCKVTIDGIKTRKGRNFLSCRNDTCKMALTRQNGQLFCQSCNATVDYPVLRYRLEVDMSDDTAQAVVVMFNETATTLVKCSADSLMDTVDESHTYYEYGTFESFIMDVEYSESENSSDSANGTGKKRAVEPSAKKRKNRYIHALGCTFTYIQSHASLF
nr:hypothetical protein [Tanacetum cinerariifolium]